MQLGFSIKILAQSNSLTKKVALSHDQTLGFSDGSKTPINGLIGFERNQKWGLLDAEKEQKLIRAQYLSIIPFQSNFIVSVRDEYSIRKKYGLIDKKGEVLISLKYNNLVPSSKFLIASTYERGQYLYGALNGKGKIIISFKYKNLTPFDDGFIIAQDFKSKKALINYEGIPATQFSFENFIKTKNNQNIITEKYGAFGMISRTGKVIYENIFKSIDSNQSPTKLSAFPKWKILNKDLKIIDEIYADSIHDISNIELIAWRNGIAYKTNLFGKTMMQIGAVNSIKKRGDLYEVTSKKGIALYDPTLQKITDFEFEKIIYHAPFYLVKTNHQYNAYWKVLNNRGRKQFTHTFTEEPIYRKELWIENKENGQIQLLDQYGVKLLSESFDNLSFLNPNEYSWMKGQEGGINYRSGRKKIKGRFSSIEELSNNFYLFKNELDSVNGFIRNNTITFETKNRLEKKAHLIVETNHTIIERKHRKLDSIYPDSIKSTLQLYNQYGNPFINYQIDSFKILNNDNQQQYHVIYKDRFASLLDRNARTLVPFSEKITDFSRTIGPYFIMTKNFQKGILDLQGRLRIANRYDDIFSLGHNLFTFKLLGKWGILNLEEEILIQPKFNKIHKLLHNIFLVENKNGFGLFHVNGKEILNPKFDQITPTENGGWITEKNKHYGYVDREGHELIQPRYDGINQISSEWIIISEFNIQSLYNISEKRFLNEDWRSVLRMNFSERWLVEVR